MCIYIYIYVKDVENVGSIILIVGLWTLELIIFDLNIGFSMRFPPRGLILRSQFWNLRPTIQKTYSKHRNNRGRVVIFDIGGSWWWVLVVLVVVLVVMGVVLLVLVAVVACHYFYYH